MNSIVKGNDLMSIQTIAPEGARRLIEEGRAALVDIREPLEHAREQIPGAILVPLSRFESHDFSTDKVRCPTAIFHCQGGSRTDANAARLAASGFAQNYVLRGGIAAWKRAGLPTKIDPSKRLSFSARCRSRRGSSYCWVSFSQ